MQGKMWKPRREPTDRESLLRLRIGHVRKFYGFLRDYRDEIFDSEFQAELGAMYRRTGAGKEPVAPALLAAATLLQAYEEASDAEAIELTIADLRWQIVLDRLGSTRPAFSQAALRDFRQRILRTNMHTRITERIALVATRTGAFDPRKLPRLDDRFMISSPSREHESSSPTTVTSNLCRTSHEV